MENYIKIKPKKDILKLGIMDEEDNIVKDNNGNEIYLEFDLADIDLPIKYNKCVGMINEAKKELKMQMVIIDKKQDHKGKGYLSQNEEAKVKAIRSFYKKMETAMDLFLGEGGTRKFLNGRKPYYEMFDDIGEALKPYEDKFRLTITDMTERIKNKYKVVESDVLTDE
ncbi:putative uncharacterized protein [Clostridium sp. CAG:452]|nr:putative uncharacterized protein [Clostridium sp. CAG:452]